MGDQVLRQHHIVNPEGAYNAQKVSARPKPAREVPHYWQEQTIERRTRQLLAKLRCCEAKQGTIQADTRARLVTSAEA